MPSEIKLFCPLLPYHSSSHSDSRCTGKRDFDTTYCKIKNHKAGFWQSDWIPLSFWDYFGNLERVQIFAKSLFSIQNNLEIIPVTWIILMYTCKKYINWWKYVCLVFSNNDMNFILTWSPHTDPFRSFLSII